MGGKQFPGWRSRSSAIGPIEEIEPIEPNECGIRSPVASAPTPWCAHTAARSRGDFDEEGEHT